MSETEGPPAKQIKLDLGKDDSTMDGEETAEEGQEEWLSEGILTDDDLHASTEAIEQTDSQSQDASDTKLEEQSNEVQSNEELHNNGELQNIEQSNDTQNTEKVLVSDTKGSTEVGTETGDKKSQVNESPKENAMDIEETLNNLEGSKNDTENLGEFLDKKTEPKSENTENKSEKQGDQDDGNDTDELLRMLSEDNNKNKKKLTKTVKDIKNSNSVSEHRSSDDEYGAQYKNNSKLKKLTKSSSKTNHADVGDGDDDDSDMSSDEEAKMMKKMFSLKQNVSNTKSNPNTQASKHNMITTKHVINAVKQQTAIKEKMVSSTPLKTYQNKSLQAKIANKMVNTLVKPEVKTNRIENKKVPVKIQTKSNQIEIKTPAPFNHSNNLKNVNSKPKMNDIFENEEYLDEEFNLDGEESDMDGELKRTSRRIMSSMMDDSDDSRSDEGSLYDELPSSGSEDMEDWFQLDLRNEKAADYLPLLGSKAKDLLLDEKRRVMSRLTNLKQSLNVLTDSGKKQAEQLRSATMMLAQIDDLLKST